MIEAELKARVRDPEAVMRLLDDRATAETAVYRDIYYDDPTGTILGQDRELRLRTVHSSSSTRSVLTYKAPRVDESGSKPEFESVVESPEAVRAILLGLGYREAIAFEKRCRNYAFESDGRRMLATLVRVPELNGTFLELETLVDDEAGIGVALDAVRVVLVGLGIFEGDLTSELYTDAVAAKRGTEARGGPSPGYELP